MATSPKSLSASATPARNAAPVRAALPPFTELMPGDVCLARTGEEMRTLLGSCVSVILTDPRRTVGAMCHIVHVGQPNAANRHNTAYGEVAMDDMFHRLLQVGIAAQQCQAYVYGGGNMFPGIVSGPSVGDRNADWVMDFLDHHGIGVVDYSLGGTAYRKVSWTVGTTAPKVENVAIAQGGFQ